MALILDASVLIAEERGAFDLEGLLASAESTDVAISAVTASELLHGVERARDSRARTARANVVGDMLDSLQVVPFGLPEARTHASLWAALVSAGKMIGAHDLIVAATALTHNATVATLNQKEFKRVPGLVLQPVARFMRT